MPSRLRRKRWLHLPHDHGEPLRQPRYNVVAAVLSALPGMLVWATHKNPTHAIVVDFPQPSLAAAVGPLTPPANRLSVDADGVITWNAEPVSRRELFGILQMTLSEHRQPALLFEPTGDAAYENVTLLLAVVHQAGLIDHCFQFSGTERYRTLDKTIHLDEPVLGQRPGCSAPIDY